MSERYPGGIISKNAPTVTGGTTGSGSAPGVWTLDQQAVYAKAGTWPSAANYIEDVFSTYLYTASNQVAQTITNGINLSGKGGLVWIKARSAAYENFLADTARGAANYLQSQSTAAQINNSTELTSFNSNGFSIGTDSSGIINFGSTTLTSWTFRKQPKFFDVVTYTGNGAAPRNIAHNLGSTPGCILIKCTNTTGDWFVWHRSMTSTTSNYLVLNSTAAQASGFYWPNGVTDTFFSVNGTLGNINTNGNTYVAYLFAHDAGGFGLTGTDNVISCGSYVGNGSLTGPNVNLGYEPQWLLVKNATTAGPNWILFDNMRGVVVGGNDARLVPNTTAAESSSLNLVEFNATGFQLAYNGNAINGSGDTYIYIAIRRGPMKTPTSGTSVFEPLTHAGTSTTRSVSTSFPSDFLMVGVRNATSARFTNTSRLTANKFMWTSATNAETTNTAVFPDNVVTSTQNAFTLGDDLGSDWVNASGNTYVDYNFRRAPGFFDVVCYTGDGASTRSVNHNLTVAPQLLIAQNRTGGGNWYAYLPSGNVRMTLNSNFASPVYGGAFAGTTPTATTFSFDVDLNTSGQNYVAYLFASCPGVSKVGSYTGTGATQTISCGFAARFVLIKRTDSTGNWWVWDTARGMVAGTDPRLPMNTTTIEANANWVYTDAAGFQIVTTDATVNASGGSYIYLAIA